MLSRDAQNSADRQRPLAVTTKHTRAQYPKYHVIIHSKIGQMFRKHCRYKTNKRIIACALSVVSSS